MPIITSESSAQHDDSSITYESYDVQRDHASSPYRGTVHQNPEGGQSVIIKLFFP